VDEHPLTRYRPTDEELQQVCAAYRIGALAMVHGELGGLFNVNLKFTTTAGGYVVRVHSGLTRLDHLTARRPLLAKLRARNIPVLMPLITAEGAGWMQLHGRFVEVTPFVSGTACQYTPPQVVAFGRMLRRFHDALRDESGAPNPYWSNYPSSGIVAEGLALLADQKKRGWHDAPLVGQVDYLYQRVMDRWGAEGPHGPTTIIHGDWHGENAIFHPDGGVQCILDFDGLQRAERLHDIAYFLWSVRLRPDHVSIGRNFLDGYGDLSPVERALLPTALARASVFFLCTASFTADPVRELALQWSAQKPYIQWLLSGDGQRSVWNLAGDLP